MKNPEWEIVQVSTLSSGMVSYTFENVLRPFVRIVIEVSSIGGRAEDAAWKYLDDIVN